MISSAHMSTGIMFGGISWRRWALGVYRDDAETSLRDEVTAVSSVSPEVRFFGSPGWVPFGVTRPPPVFLFGGAIVE